MCKKINEIFKKIKYGDLQRSVDNKSDYYEFTSIDEATKWGMKFYQEWADKYQKTMKTAKGILTDPMITSPIECYCGYSYRQINSHLRFGNESNYLYKEMANLLTILLCNAPRIPCDIIAYRLVCSQFIESLISHNKKTPSTPVQEKGFMSTGLLSDIVNREEAYAKEEHLLKIYIPKNTIGLYVNAITCRAEQEIMITTNSYLALVEYPYKDSVLNKIVYECKLITQSKF